MYLLYLDESGPANAGYFVVGGLAVHEQDAWVLSQRVEALSDSVSNQGRGAEFHASPMRRGRGEWSTVPRVERETLIENIARLLNEPLPTTGKPPVLFAVAHHRASFPHHKPYERTSEEFFGRCNGFIGRLAASGDRHRCIAISDKSDNLERALQEQMSRWRVAGASTGSQIGPMASYAEVPLFVDSRASRLVQLSDFVAYWTFRAYTNQDHRVLDLLLPSFVTERHGPIHGFVHLVRNYRSCGCAACRSRR